MAGNSQRRGRRKEGSKKGPTIGTGGHGRQALEGRGRTLPASERPWHKAYEGGATERRRRAPARGVAKTRRPPAAAPGQELVGGRNAVLEALRAGVPATTLYVAERADIDDRLRESLRLAADTGVSVLEVPRPQLDRFAGGGSHQGVALAVPPYEYAHPDDLLARADESGQPPLVVALDSVTDPRNLGAVVRSAAAFGAHGVVVPERRAAGMSAGAWKASAGAAARIPVARAANLTRALTAYRQAGLFVVGLAADGDTPLADLEMAGEPLVVVVGSEGRGLSRLVAESCDVTVRIPMATGTESLNAGVAAGIVLYEIARARS